MNYKNNYCNHCGARLDDGAEFCGQCGIPVKKLQKSALGFKIPDQNGSKVCMKKWTKSIMLLGVIIVIFVCVKIAMNSIGYRVLVHNTVTALEKDDIDTLVSLSSDLAYHDYHESEICDYYRTRTELKFDYESDFKLTYEVKAVYDISINSVRFESMKSTNELLSNVDINGDQEIRCVYANAKVEQNDECDDRYIRISMIKENGKWRLIDLSF